jgi:tetratricopeptide (TPR) repeat protein
MKKMSLSPEEIKKISQLLLSEAEESAELGYELFKQNRVDFEPLRHELMLIAMLGPKNRLRKKVKRYTNAQFKKTGVFEQMNAEWAIFEKGFHYYSSCPQFEKLLTDHEKIRLEYYPYVIRNKTFAEHYYRLASRFQFVIKSEFDLCKKYYDTVITANPEHEQAFFNLGLLHGIKEPKKAKEYYIQAIKNDSNFAPAYNNLGAVYANIENDFEEAYRCYSKALSLMPNTVLYQSNLASACLRLKYLEEFEKLIFELLCIEPISIKTINLYFIYLWEEKKNYSLAEDLARDGLKKFPDNEILMGNMAEMYMLALGRYEEAYELYKAAFKINKTVYKLFNIITLLVLKLNYITEATLYYNELLILTDNNIERDRDLKDNQWDDFTAAEKILLKTN